MSTKYMGNTNNMSEFILLGLTQDQVLQKACFGMFLVFYTAILMGNLLIIATIKTSPRLMSPMYFFLSYLSFVDICYSSVTAPKLISDFLVEKKTISYVGCMAQLFGVHFFGCTEIFLLTVMAYDRYIAICKPLHYTTIINKSVCSWMVVFSWLGGFVHSLVQTLLTVHLPFCGPNEIDHYFCDVHPLLKLACTDTYIIGLIVIANTPARHLTCRTRSTLDIPDRRAMRGELIARTLIEDSRREGRLNCALARCQHGSLLRTITRDSTALESLACSYRRDILATARHWQRIYWYMDDLINVCWENVQEQWNRTAVIEREQRNRTAVMECGQRAIEGLRTEVCSMAGALQQLATTRPVPEIQEVTGGTQVLFEDSGDEGPAPSCLVPSSEPTQPPETLLTVNLPFCGPNEIDHYFCDVYPLLKLACSDTHIVGALVVANTGMIALGCFVVLVVSYAVILLTLRVQSAEGRHKALSTCASHITVVLLLFGPCLFIYVRPSTTLPVDKVFALFYTILTPMLNPIIYTLRNTEMKNSMKKLWKKTRRCCEPQ
ncbi:hypothetical protein JD844_022197 [Phrynosoma platyrhinos]|uniref:G-protein coupled receptors family 1 profile domain-containing protein n=1 Tax=Phrynosoma platyrhinos TaxID=52577 RepID=A0ABQ7SV57_PHRPL|nr:hypothetical protein JD844_022197 [Phrynosoma platyrhinos]